MPFWHFCYFRPDIHFAIFNLLPMKKNAPVRDYKFSDAHLVQLSDAKADAIQRDLSELSDYGLNAAKLQNFRALRDAFANQPDDLILEGEQMEATENKNNSRDELTKQLNRFLTAAINAWGKGSGKYRRMGLTAPTQLTDDELVRATRSVIRTATDLLNELSGEGITAGVISTLQQALQAFDALVDKQAEAIRSRDIATEDRIESGNALYQEMIKLCRTARTYWRDKNEAKYNDYRIYNSIHGTPGEGEVE